LAEIIQINKINELSSKLKKEGKTIVFTNGCFDIVHAGHVDYMEKAKFLGDVLVVGVNSDNSVKRIKGEKRPIVDIKNRLRLLQGLSVIDYLCVFEEDTPLELIKNVSPNVLVKGEDWKDKGVVGEAFVKTYGGKVELIKLLPGISTSIIIDKIVNTYK
jgi:D-beta-D-heptose 7-phosphate kinase/D-beta-D-heptose 1-phosphate adenosyltransferase